MCGIAGIVGRNAPVHNESVCFMVAAARHRGPDEAGTVVFARCVLGHARLAIIDPAGGEQPMANDDGSIALTFNGVIYNFRELRQELEQVGRTFRTNSDTEVLLRAYEEWGADAPRHLNGQFAFAVWDDQRQELFAARDRLGEKPFYWTTTTSGDFLFGSEIKQLLTTGLVRTTIDPEAVAAYLSLLYVPPSRTMYGDVHTLPPGHTLRLADGRVSVDEYWRPRLTHAVVEEEDAVRRIRELIERAVERQTVADVPVGAFLSGGLDSTTIVGCLAERASLPVRTFSVGFGALIDELPYARAVAERYRTEHYELAAEIDVGEMLERMTDVYDEPLADSSNIPTFIISEFARRHVKVGLSGDGGDELFGGYAWYGVLHEVGEFDSRRQAYGLGAAAFAARAACKLGFRAGTRRDELVRRSSLARLAVDNPRGIDRHLALVAQRDVWGSAQRPRPVFYVPTGLAPEDEAAYYDLTTYLPGDILVKVDRAALGNGLETRAPFLDVDLVEFVLSLPPSLRLRKGAPKYLLRRACADLWPPEVVNRSKQGFGAPVEEWIERPDVTRLLERVLTPGSALLELLPHARTAQATLTAQERWTILCLGLWLEKRSASVDIAA